MPQYQGVWTLPVAARLQSTQQWATDPLYRNTTLLLQADNAANGAQNNTFIDLSPNNFTITRNSNTTQGTFTPYSATGWSNYFTGSGSYLSNTSAALIGSTVSTFTAEAWIYMTTVPTSDANNVGSVITLDGQAAGTVNYLAFGPLTNQRLCLRWFDGAGKTCNGSTVLALNTWHHIAVVVSSNTISMYVNGVPETLSGTTTLTNRNGTSNQFAIATNNYTNFSGYISNVRVTNTAVYTSAFAPSTAPLTSPSGTLLLTCQSNRFFDANTQTTAKVLTPAGGLTAVQAFSPFAPQYQWTAPVISGSGYGGGSVGYLLAPASSNFQYPGDFSIETWVYVTTSNLGPIWGTAGGGGSDQIYLNGNTNIFYDNTNFTYFNSASSVLPYTWSHICITRQSSTLRMIINGVLVGSKTQVGTLGSAATGPGIFIRASLDDQVGGPVYMADLRVCKGSVPTSYQTSSTTAGTVIFTPPTQAVTTTSQGATSSNVSLLLNFTNAGIYDGAMKVDLQTVGNAQVSTSVVKYGTGSMAFDGTGDYLTSNASITDLCAFGAGDFTIETWVYFNVVNSIQAIYDSRPLSTQGAYPLIYLNSDGTIRYFANGGDQIISSAVLTGVWYHLAIVRLNGVTRMFLNGVQTGSTYTDSTVYINSVGRPWIGLNAFNGTQGLNGYIDDLRVTKGVARYTSNFTPPTVALPRQ